MTCRLASIYCVPNLSSLKGSSNMFFKTHIHSNHASKAINMACHPQTLAFICHGIQSCYLRATSISQGSNKDKSIALRMFIMFHQSKRFIIFINYIIFIKSIKQAYSLSKPTACSYDYAWLTLLISLHHSIYPSMHVHVIMYVHVVHPR